MVQQNQELFPQIFLSGVKVFGARPFIYERHEKMFVSTLGKEIASQINTMARALSGIGVKLDSRVAFFGLPPSQAYWITEWATMCIRGMAVIIPSRFTKEQRLNILAESRSNVVVVDSIADANEMAQMVTTLPDLKHIICLGAKSSVSGPKLVRLEDVTKPQITILYYREFIESGKRQPDVTGQALASMSPSDRALLFFFPDPEKGGHTGIRYTHAQLCDHARIIERLLGKAHALQETDIILTAPSWNLMVSHIASCFLPVLKDASIQIHPGKDDFQVFENRPHVLVADAEYIRALKDHVDQLMKKAGKLEYAMFRKALAYGKRKFEKEDKIGIMRSLSDKFLENTVVRKASKILGGRLRLIIGVDDAASYDTQLFFHTFGVDLVEVPPEAFTHIAD
jgi:long-subunit acyl-CoA synthetase (AMP-forming)